MEEEAAGSCAQAILAKPMAMDSGLRLEPLGKLEDCRIKTRCRMPSQPHRREEALPSSRRPPSPPRPAKDRRRGRALPRMRRRRLLKKKLAEIAAAAVFHLGNSTPRSHGTRLASRPDANTVELHRQALLAEISVAPATARDTSCHQRHAAAKRSFGTHQSRPAGPGALLPNLPTTGENNLPLQPKATPAHLLCPRRPATPPRAARDLTGTALSTLNGS